MIAAIYAQRAWVPQWQEGQLRRSGSSIVFQPLSGQLKNEVPPSDPVW